MSALQSWQIKVFAKTLNLHLVHEPLRVELELVQLLVMDASHGIHSDSVNAYTYSVIGLRYNDHPCTPISGKFDLGYYSESFHPLKLSSNVPHKWDCQPFVLELIWHKVWSQV